jgi:diaminopimelate decarboxylase
MKSLSARLCKSFVEATGAHGTPLHVYDEKEMVDNARRLNEAFSWCESFREYFAVKATPNPFIMRILANQGFGMDCSSLAELELSKRCGVAGESIMFTSNNTPLSEYAEAKALGAIINLDDISHLDFLQQGLGLPETLSFRLNPGELLGGSDIIGNPKEAKFGLTRTQLFEAYRHARELGVKRYGLHTMPISNELDGRYFAKTVELLLSIVCELKREMGITIDFINMGGGLGIPYRPDDKSLSIAEVSASIRQVYDRMLNGSEISPPRLFMECGRYITGPYGYLITEVIHKKDTYRNYIGVDATMADLMRPGMYGAYHHISVLRDGEVQLEQGEGEKYDVVGSLCENNDKFAVQRLLPPIEIGDTLVIHDTGAHGHSMGFNYNGKLRAAEVLIRRNGALVEIRRKETLADHFATLAFDALEDFKL